MNKKLLFFTACDKKHTQFILPYIYFAALNNPNSCFEIITDVYDNINILTGCNYIKSLFDCEILLRPIQYDIPCMYLRFLQQPCLKADYCYIGDIDILIYEDVLSFHLQKLQQNQTIIDNQVRLLETNRLTGLHFVDYQYFDLVKKAQQQFLNIDKKELLKLNDERILLDICNQSGLKIPPIAVNENQFSLNRPIHGLHFSLNRRPFKPESSMKFSYTDQSKQWLLTQIKDVRFVKLITYLDSLFLKNLQIILDFIQEK